MSQMKMDNILKKFFLVGIVLLQSHVWIVLSDGVFQGGPSEDANLKSSNDDRPKTETNNVSQSSSHIPIPSSFVTNPPSSAPVDSFIYSNASSTSIQGSAFPIDADSVKLLNVSIQQTFSNSSSIHQNSSFVASPVVDASSSILSKSSYSLESYNLSEITSLSPANTSRYTNDKTHSHLPSSVLFVLQDNNSSSSYDSYSFVKSASQRTGSVSLNEKIIPTPVAESRILIMTSSYSPSLKEFLDLQSTHPSEKIQGSKIQANKSLNIQVHSGNILDSLSIDDDIPELKENKPTVSLSQEINTDFSNFFIETSIASTDSTKRYSDLETQGASEEILSFKVPSAISNTGSLNSKFRIHNVEPNNESTHSLSHEIIKDDDTIKNKTSRNEDAEIDEIVSGIIHLLAGNVQVVRPGVGVNPNRHHRPPQPTPASTRINNRGPIRPNTLSRTVVVFSQPPNKGHPSEIALPGHLFPSTIQNPQFVRVRPTKIGEHAPSAVIHFYQQGIQPPLPPLSGQPIPLPPHHVPFNGEVFNPNNRPINKVRNTTPPDEFVRPSFINPERQHTNNGNPVNKYQHFIFSDDTASSVVVLRPSKQPSADIFPNIRQEKPRNESSTNENVPSHSFEVLIDNTVKKTVFVSPAKTLSSDDLNKKVTSYGPHSSNVVIFPTKTESTFPHGPVTDWVPFAERPSVRNGANSFAADENVSIIMHPIIFDVTVSNSVGDIGINKYSVGVQNKSTLSVTATEVLNSKVNISSETTKQFSTLDSESVIITTKLLGEKDLQPESHLVLEKIMDNPETAVPETIISISQTADVVSTSSINLTPTYRKEVSSPAPATVTPEINLHSSFNQGGAYTEKRASAELSLKHSSSRSHSSHSSSKSIQMTRTTPTELTMLGKPIVIPVDIEDVRPYVGGFNPPYQDRNREKNFPGHFGGTHRSTTDDSVRRMSSTTSRVPIIRSQARPRPNVVRIDTCIVGDDSTCDVNQNETCRTEQGISSCHCRPGYARSYTRGPCVPVVSLMLSIKVDRYENRKLQFTPRYMDKKSEEFKFLEYEAKVAMTSMLSQIPAFARTFLGLRINSFYPLGDRMAINSTILLEEKESTRTQAVRLRLRQLIGEAVKNKQQNIGDSRLFADASYSPVTAVEDINECSDNKLNDCSVEGMCFNVFGTYLCKCRAGYVDPFPHDERKSGRKCSACSLEYCSFHGKCFVEKEKKICKCHGNYIGSRCEIDGEVLGVALGASLAAIIIILLTLGCLCIWNRKWKQKQHKADMLSSRSYNSNQAYGYSANAMNGSINPYHLTMEDRMRWAQISDVMKNIPEPQDLPMYLPPTPAPLDPSTFASRCQPSDDEISWYDCRSRPRSRIMGQYGGVPGPTCFEMDVSSRMSYAGKSYHSSKRPKYPVTRH